MIDYVTAHAFTLLAMKEEENQFQVGDLVKCVEGYGAGGGPVEGEFYYVEKSFPGNQIDLVGVSMKGGWQSKRFVLVERKYAEGEEGTKDFKVGDWVELNTNQHPPFKTKEPYRIISDKYCKGGLSGTDQCFRLVHSTTGEEREFHPKFILRKIVRMSTTSVAPTFKVGDFVKRKNSLDNNSYRISEVKGGLLIFDGAVLPGGDYRDDFRPGYGEATTDEVEFVPTHFIRSSPKGIPSFQYGTAGEVGVKLDVFRDLWKSVGLTRSNYPYYMMGWDPFGKAVDDDDHYQKPVSIASKPKKRRITIL